MKYLKNAYFLVFFGFLFLLILSVFSGNDIRGTESNVIYTLQQILDDNSLLYQNPNELPYSVTQYTPLYYLICDAVLSLFGVKATSVLTIIITSRCISLVFLVLSAYYFYKIILQFHVQQFLLLLFVTLFIVATFPWYSISRPDVLVLFFVLISIRILQKHLQSKDPTYSIYVGVICFLAIASKQNGFILPLTIGVFFLINKAWKSLLYLISGFAVGFFIVYTILLLGHYELIFLKANIIDGINNDMDFAYALKRPYKSFVIYFGLFSIAFYYLLKGNYKAWLTPKFSLKYFLMLSLVIWFFLSSVLAFKVGSGINYFNEAIVIALIIACKELSNKMKFKLFDLHRAYILLYIIAIQICLVHFYHYPFKIAKGLYETYVSESNVRDDIDLLLSNNLGDSYFFSDDRKINLAHYERCILPQIEIQEASFKSRNFNLNNLENDFKDGNITYLILYNRIRPILNLKLSDLYEFEVQIGNLNIYKFKPD
jgi:hypothetical protein